MNPHLLLALWRERWGKAGEANLRTTHVLGKPNSIGAHLVQARVWAVPGVNNGIIVVCTAVFIWLLSIRFSLGGQVAFSLLVAAFALYLQRYKGTLVTLTLFGMSVLVSSRYLGWRFVDTLGHDFNHEYLLALGLFIAELHLWMLGVLGFINRLWPLRQATERLPDSQSKWPTVDVYLPIHSRDADTALHSCLSALSLEWPKGRLQVFLLDGIYRPALQEIAASLRITYIATSDPATTAADTINLALNQTQGELVAIFDGDAVPRKNFLKESLGWFAKDPALGILETAQSSTLALSLTATTQCTLLRRALAVEAGGLELGTRNPYSAMASRLRHLGYCSGDMSFDTHSSADISVYRLDHSSIGKVPRWKVHLVLVETVLQFYSPVALWILLTAPTMYLLGNVRLIHSGLDLFAAYAIPHLLNTHIVKTRIRTPGRLPIWLDIRDTLLAWYMPFPTVVVVCRTKLKKILERYGAKRYRECTSERLERKISPPEKFHWTLRTAFTVVLMLNLLALLVGGLLPNWSGIAYRSESTAYIFWCLLNLAMLLATLGVAEEGRCIRQHMQSLACLPAMIRTPSGHTVRCLTTDFPSATLTLSLPTTFPLAADSQIDVSIFFEHIEFSFSACIEGLEGTLLRIRIDETARDRYQLAAIAIFSRGPDWPDWLPGPNADNPFPPWLTTRFNASVGVTMALIAKLSNTLQLARLVRWIQKRTNAT
jgi:cellulose synthase (UDP-forming)